MRVRKRSLDRVAQWTLVAVLAAVALPWLFRADERSLAGPSRAALAFVVAYQLAAWAGDRLTTRAGLWAATGLLQLGFIVFLALLWGGLGGVGNPGLLLAFGAPVGALAALVGRWTAVAGAGLSAGAVAAVALGQSSTLRWYATRAGLGSSDVTSALGPLLPTADAAGTTPAPTQFALLATFSVLLLSWAVVSHEAVRVARRLVPWRRPAPGVGLAGLAALREPTLIVEATSAAVAEVSRGFTQQMLLHGEDLAGRDLFSLLAFDDEAAVRRLLEDGGVDPECRYRVDGEARIAELEARPFEQGEARYCWLRLADRSEAWWLGAALGAAGEAVLVVGEDGRLRQASSEARDLLGDLYPGLEADVALETAGLGAERWRSTAEREERVEIGGRAYRVTIVPVRVGSGDEAAWLLRLRQESGE